MSSADVIFFAPWRLARQREALRVIYRRCAVPFVGQVRLRIMPNDDGPSRPLPKAIFASARDRPNLT
jgi:hypothetical protein